MNKSELNPDPDLSVPAIPVICDKCRAEGMAGDEAFSGVPDLLDFEPVQRRARSDGWKPEHQRAFIAALALTGSPRQAARTIGKHEFGAQRLRQARGGRSFAAAWDAAEDLYRERERERIHANLKDLADQRDDSPSPLAGEGRGEGDEDSPTRELDEARDRILKRVERIQRDYLLEIRRDPEQRRAYEILNGPVDWDDPRVSLRDRKDEE